MKALSTTLLLLATTWLLLSGCSSDQSAPGPRTCETGGPCNIGATCAKAADCQGSYCDLGVGTCVGCLIDANCSAGSDCVAGACSARCEADAQCDEGRHCTASKHCAECATDAQCDPLAHCTNGRCVEDTCTKATSACDPTDNGIRVCSARGDASQLVPCAASQTCVDGANGPTCSAWGCTPKAVSCVPGENAVHACAEDGLSYEDSTPCADDERCVAGKCASSACTPNRSFCEGNDSRSCSSDGATSTLLQSCGDLALCDESTGICRPKTCTPGSKVCSEQNVATCRADGSGYDSVPCSKDQTCLAGACTALICAANETFCGSSTSVSYCNSAGTSLISTYSCSAGQRCTSLGGSAGCTSSSCTANVPMCDGSTATVCKGDGSGPAPGGTSCTAAGAYCSAGKCIAQVCTPNARFCSGNVVYQCSTDGASSYYYTGCSSSTVCNPVTAACVSPLGAPNAVACSGNTVVKLDVLGLAAATIQDCATTSQTCSQGQCVSQVCTANTNFCKNGDAYQCNSTGTGEALLSVCSPTTHCQSGYCTPNACVPGAKVCSGNSVVTCNADGTLPTGAGTACASGEACVSGVCQTKVCTEYSTSCVDGDVFQCNALGTGKQLYQHCFSDAFCSAGACVPDVCLGGSPYCSGETLATCANDGSGPASGTVTDCKASSQVCTRDGCVASAVETIGTAADYASARTFGQVVYVTTPRKLTRLAFNNMFDATSATVSTVVYSSTDGINFYVLSTSAPSPGPTSGFYESGALSVQLQAGLYYLIGMTSTNTAYIYPRYDSTTLPQYLSFATQQKSVVSTATAGTSFAPSQGTLNLNLRITTTLP